MRRTATFGKVIVLVATAGLAAITSSAAMGGQFPTLDPNYTQQIYTGPLVGGPGMAWTSSNHLLTRNGSNILEYSPTQNTTYQGTNLHGAIANQTVPGLSPIGYGMTNGLDGYVYTVTGTGLQRFDGNNLATPAQSLPGTAGGQGYGITTLPDGRIAYSDGIPNSSVWIYNPTTTSNTLIYSGSALIDGMVAGPTGHIALTGQNNSTMTIITNTGTVVNTFNTPHFPDGLAFSATATSTTLYSNNNDGTITRYVLGPGFSGVPVTTDIASGSQAYGDLASVGPDCAFYVSQFDNGGFHGSTAGIGTHWDNLVTTNEPSIVRIGTASVLPGACEFYTPLTGNVPEPNGLLILGAAIPWLCRRRWRRQHPVC
jgi:hypothetical protein